jgi:hypothetical protein
MLHTHPCLPGYTGNFHCNIVCAQCRHSKPQDVLAHDQANMARTHKLSCLFYSCEASTSLQLEAITLGITHLHSIIYSSPSNIMQTQRATYSLHQRHAAVSTSPKHASSLITHSGSRRLARREQYFVPASYKRIDIIEPQLHKPKPSTRQDSCYQVPDHRLVRKPVPNAASRQKHDQDDVSSLHAPGAPSSSMSAQRKRDTVIPYEDQAPYIFDRGTIIAASNRASSMSNIERDYGAIQMRTKATLHVANVAGRIAIDTYMQPPPRRVFKGVYGEDLSRSLDGDHGMLDRGRTTRQLRRDISALIVHEARDKIRKLRGQGSSVKLPRFCDMCGMLRSLR